jgi:hypothetical protein
MAARLRGYARYGKDRRAISFNVLAALRGMVIGLCTGLLP